MKLKHVVDGKGLYTRHRYVEMSECLACGDTNLKECLDLGEQPLANNYDSNEKYPLKLMYCDNCWHAQLSYFVDPEKLYRNYYYVSGTSNTLKEWFSDFADRFGEGKDKPILDIASNDGSLLLEFKKRGWRTVGVDPAENIDTQGIDTRHDFFDETWAIPNTSFSIITAFNVLAHGPNPLSVMKGIYNNLHLDGVAYVMTSQGSQFENGQFDTIYHEHHSYFSPRSFQKLANRAGFTDINMTVEPIHGGSMLFKLTKSNKKTSLMCERPDFEGFKAKRELVKPYKTIGFGAAAKGVVVINALKQDLEYVVDEAPLKIGKNIPGTDIPIVDIEFMANDPDNLFIIVYAWNFYDEILNKIREARPDRQDVVTRYWF